MATATEFLQSARKIPDQARQSDRSRELIVVRYDHVPKIDRTSEIEGRMRDYLRDRAKEALRSDGILDVLESVVEKMDPERKAALDFGFEGLASAPMGVIRWAPEISKETGGVESKAVKVVSRLKGTKPDVYFADLNWKKEGIRFDWTKFNPASEDVAGSSLFNIIKLAMSTATVKIEDSRAFDGENYTGHPGVEILNK